MKFINRKLMNTNNTSFLALTNPSISLLFILPLFPFSFDGLHHNPPPAPPPKETEEAATTMYQSSPSPSSTEERKGDPRFYLLSAFFFSCIVTGGLFLGLYIFLPPDETQPWYPIPGLILVAIPWIFWFLTYIYRCIRPKHATNHLCKSIPRSTSGESQMHSLNDVQEYSTKEHSSNEGRGHVHSEGVIVIREYEEDNHENNSRNDDGDDNMKAQKPSAEVAGHHCRKKRRWLILVERS